VPDKKQLKDGKYRKIFAGRRLAAAKIGFRQAPKKIVFFMRGAIIIRYRSD
jgi:hypothetical protein